MSSEKSIMNSSLVAVSAMPETMCWRNNTGVAWQGSKIPMALGGRIVMRPGMVILADARPIRFGVNGSGDVLGVTGGRAWAQEYKSAVGAQSEDQINFQRKFERSGGSYALIRSVEQAERHIAELLKR